MFGVILVPLCLAIVCGVTAFFGESKRVLRVFVLSYVFRMLFLIIVRDVQWFSHAAGGDSVGYEMLAGLVCDYWQVNGISYVTQDQVWEIGPTSLPINLFALIMYLNGGATRAGCTAVIAMVACLTCLNFLRLARELGADPKVAEKVMFVILVMPSFIIYTSDMYKDGLVLFCVIGAVGSAIRLARRLRVIDIVFGIACLVAVWGVRYYLVFTCITPLIVGLAGFGGRSVVRPIIVCFISIAVITVVAQYTHIIEDAEESANTAFEFSYGWRAQLSNHNGGSGVAFDDGGDPLGAIHEKLTYTLLAPFPWMTGSFGLNAGKIDTMIFYYFLYRGFLAGKRLAVQNKGLLITFLTFLLPMTLMYAMTVSNVGLILRQRMPIVVMTMLMATLSWPRRDPVPEVEAEEEEGDRTTDADLVPAVPSEAKAGE